MIALSIVANFISNFSDARMLWSAQWLTLRPRSFGQSSHHRAVAENEVVKLAMWLGLSIPAVY